MTEKRFTKQEFYDGINRYRINKSNFIVEILDDGIPMHYSTIVNRLNEQHKTIIRLEKENEQLQTKNNAYLQDIEVYREENTHLKLENEKLKKDCSNLIDDNTEYVAEINQMHKENEQLYELIDFANTLIAFKTSESCQKEWKKKLKELEND